MEVQEYIGYVVSEGERLAAVADEAALSAEIPACPGWDMRELVRHTGLIHLWAAGHMAFPHQLPQDVDMPELAVLWPELAQWPSDENLVTWYRDTHANLVSVLRETPVDVDCFTFLPAPNAVAMWSRRQASEIAIHRFDAEVALGMDTFFEPHFAAEMLDEMLMGFAPGPRESRPLPVDGPKTIRVGADDTTDEWFVTLDTNEVSTSRTGDHADLTVSGTAASLYLLFWNRTPNKPVAMAGEAELMDIWRGNCRIMWS